MTGARPVRLAAILGVLTAIALGAPPVAARPVDAIGPRASGSSRSSVDPGLTAPGLPQWLAPRSRTALPESAVGAHRWPVDGPVVGTWDAPTNPYLAGHRGVDLAVGPATTVRASASGRVGFAGVVAGRAWVSVDHGHGLRTTVGPMATTAVAAGDAVTASTVLGTAAGTAHADGSTPRTSRLHWSARVDGTYVDPAPLVGRLVATLLPRS